MIEGIYSTCSTNGGKEYIYTILIDCASRL